MTGKKARILAALIFLFFVAAGCLPVPVSTVLLHPRQQRPIAVESLLAENFGTFSSPTFDSSGTLLATYDSGNKLVYIFRSADLAPVYTFKPTRAPRRLSFSPGGRFLVIETYEGWINDSLNNKGSAPSHVDIDSPLAVRDAVQRVEIWEPGSGQTIPDLSCDAVATTTPEGGWLWAKRWAITPGYRSSALLAAHFSADEEEFSVLCRNGVQQRWDSRTWKRRADLPPPPFWDALMGLSTASWLADGRIVLLRLQEKSSGLGTLYFWDRNTSQVQTLPGECADRLPPVFSLSMDGQRVVVVCNKMMGYSVHAWELGSGQKLPLEDAEFGFIRGAPSIDSKGVALSPDGRYLAVALLGQMEALLPNVLLVPAVLARSDLRIWDLDSGRELITVPIDDLDGGIGFLGGVGLAFSPDSATLAVGGRRLRIYRLSDLAAGAP